MKPNALDIAQAAMNASQREIDAWKMATTADDVIPAGYRCTEEWGKIWGKCESSARKFLFSLVASKKMVMKRFKKRQADGIARPKPYYKLI